MLTEELHSGIPKLFVRGSHIYGWSYEDCYIVLQENWKNNLYESNRIMQEYFDVIMNIAKILKEQNSFFLREAWGPESFRKYSARVFSYNIEKDELENDRKRMTELLEFKTKEETRFSNERKLTEMRKKRGKEFKKLVDNNRTLGIDGIYADLVYYSVKNCLV